MKVLGQDNIHRLKDVIDKDIDKFRDTDWAYEKKVKDFFNSCMDQFTSTTITSVLNPLLDEINKMGGWYVLGSDSYSRFNHTRAHAKNLGHDHMVDTFFYYDIEPLDQQHQHHFLTLKEDWLMPLPFYLWDRSDVNIIFVFDYF